MLFKRYVNCPLCFERIKISDIGFKCENPGCKGKPAVFRPQNAISPLEKMGLKSAPKRYPHECGNFATARICPKCQQEIPTDVDELSDMSIAIIGAKESGKSHYVAMLIYWIKCMGDEFGWNLTALTETTIDRYEQEFRRPLFDRHESIQSTNLVRGAGQVSPLIYSLSIGKGVLSRRIMLVFFDAAGENLEDNGNIQYISRYIYNASGIICLLDPLQLVRVRETLVSKYGEGALPEKNAETGTIINRVERLLRKNLDIGGGRIKIPLAVAFSKMDFVREAGDNAAGVYDELFRDTRHHGAFCEPEFKNIDQLMRSWVREVDVSADILAQSGNFEENAFFGFSALGCNPKGNGERLDRDPRSFRVEDPFLWLLRQKGLIKAMKG